jgi:hypothetical protein
LNVSELKLIKRTNVYEKLDCERLDRKDLVAEETHSRSGKLYSGHTRMALGNTRMGWLRKGSFGADTRHTRVIRVFLVVVRVWSMSYAYE